jgi:DNA repair protein RadC
MPPRLSTKEAYLRMGKRISVYTVKLVRESAKIYDLETKTVRSPIDAANAFREVFDTDSLTKEHFLLATLNTKNMIIGMHVIHIGSVNASICHPREIYQQALLNNATSIIACHNHPSGEVTPSPEDIDITQRLNEAGKLIGIDLLDHIILGDDMKFLSLKEKGYV